MFVSVPRSARRPPAETRQLMLETIGFFLESKAPWEIRASQVAAAAGTTQPNFYSHFRNIEEAILARADQVWALYPTTQLVGLLEKGLGSEGDTELEHFFALTIEFWCAHAGLLRAVSRMAGDENPTVRSVRHLAQDPVIAVCATAIVQAQAHGVLPLALEPALAANAALRFLDEAANHYPSMRETGAYSREAITQTIVPMFRRLLTGR